MRTSMKLLSTWWLFALPLLLQTSATYATKHNKENEGSHEKMLENETRSFIETRHSPFYVRDSKELNRALAILEHESQTWYRSEENRWWVDEGQESKHTKVEATASRRNKKNRHNKDKERETFFGRIYIVQPGDYHLDRDFIFSDGFKLEIGGVPNNDKHHKTDDSNLEHQNGNNGIPNNQKVVIHAAPKRRHFIFDDYAILKACDLTFVDGGCEVEGFYGGSMLFVNRATGKFDDVHFKNNIAWVGGALYAENARWLEFNYVSFDHNTADRKGGAVAIEEDRWEGNKKKIHHEHGKDISASASGVDDLDTFNEENMHGKNEDKKHKKGGRRISRVHFNQVLFTRNQADSGGAIFNAGSRTDVDDSHFSRNHARLGGAIYNNHRGRFLVRDSTFYANEASAKGGAIFNSGAMWILCSRFQDNQAPLGYDIFNNGHLKCTASTDFVKIDGNGEGYCHACVQPATAAPNVKVTPKRRVKKGTDEKSEKYYEDESGLFGGMFNKHNAGKQSGYVYDYYRKGESTAFDRWNGYYNAWDAEEADAQKDYAHSHDKNHHHAV